MGHLSPMELYEGNLEGGSFTGAPWVCVKKDSGEGHLSLSIGAPLGEQEGGGGSYTEDFERRMKEGSRNGASLSEGTLWGEPVGGDLLLEISKDMLSKASFSIGVLLSGNMERRSFPGAFERMENFLYVGKFLWGIWENVKKAL